MGNPFLSLILSFEADLAAYLGKSNMAVSCLSLEKRNFQTGYLKSCTIPVLRDFSV